MAKLIGVLREDQWHFANRQLPLDIDESLTMIMQFTDMSANFDHHGLKNKDLEQFGLKFRLLSKDEITKALIASGRELFSTLSQTVTCVGCRRSVDRLFNQLSESGHPALDPLIITVDGILTLQENLIVDSRSLCELLYLLSSKLNHIIDNIPKNKKNRRCLLHSLESQRAKPVGNWLEVWDLMSKECREEVILVESDVLLETLESYLRKHRFCGDCKSKVMRAYNILIGRLDASKEKGYASHLYKDIRCCPPEKHVHVRGDTDFISRLITRAEPEFRGNLSFSSRERHAKTVENAQEEVLTCLGICLYERLHRIWQRLHEEEQTWQILLCVGVNELRKNFELAVEAKQGFTQLERVCEELSREELVKQQRLEHKRQKRKKKKNNKMMLENGANKENDNNNNGEESCECEQELRESDQEQCANCNGDAEGPSSVSCHCDNMIASENFVPSYTFDESSQADVACSCCKQMRKDKAGNCSESGYCSANSNESSSSSSCENSEIASSEGLYCDHESDSHTNHSDIPTMYCSNSSEKCSSNLVCRCLPVKWVCNGVTFRCCMIDTGYGTSLQDMLEESSCASDDNEEKIPPEEVLELKAKLCELDHERQKLRQRLRQRFANFRQGVLFKCMPVVPGSNATATGINRNKSSQLNQ